MTMMETWIFFRPMTTSLIFYSEMTVVLIKKWALQVVSLPTAKDRKLVLCTLLWEI